MISELKLDTSSEFESKEIQNISHFEQIKAKLNKWKSNNSKVVATNTIDSFIKKKNEPIDNTSKNNSTEVLIENQGFPISSNCDEITEVGDTENKIVELTQESLEDNNLNSINVELIECCIDNSNDKNNKCLKIDAKNSHKKNDKIDHVVSAENVSESKNLNIKDTEINFNLPKIEMDISIEIDTSIAPNDRQCVIVETNIEQIKLRLKSLKSRIPENQKMKTRFYATIDPNKNIEAENELSREISKDMFSRVSTVTILIFIII